MRTSPLIQKVDAVTIPVPDLDAGLRFYRDSLGHRLLWRSDAALRGRPSELRRNGLALSSQVQVSSRIFPASRAWEESSPRRSSRRPCA
jgi:catechol 2,3-dioxygenase-like lactoylglutathione lyase family enzyme